MFDILFRKNKFQKGGIVPAPKELDNVPCKIDLSIHEKANSNIPSRPFIPYLTEEEVENLNKLFRSTGVNMSDLEMNMQLNKLKNLIESSQQNMMLAYVEAGKISENISTSEKIQQHAKYKYKLPTKNNNLTQMSEEIFNNNVAVGWWTREDSILPNKEYITLCASKLALCHSELSEALEGLRKNLNDDHLPHRKMVEVELADTIIRILDLAGFMGLDIGAAVAEKFKYNQSRSDHKKENRDAAGGKTI